MRWAILPGLGPVVETDYIHEKLDAYVDAGADHDLINDGGVADQTAKIVEARDHAATDDIPLILPSGTFLHTGVTIAEQGQIIRGAGLYQTILKGPLTLAAPSLDLAGFAIDATGHNHGLIAQGALQSELALRVFNAISHGFLIDAVGNNNLMKLWGGDYHDNGGCGIYEADYGSIGDANGIGLVEVRARLNGSHGALLRGATSKLWGGTYTYNGGYGIQIGEPGDLTWWGGHEIMYPWLEGNALGGIRSETNGTNKYARGQSAQGVDRSNSPRIVEVVGDLAGNLAGALSIIVGSDFKTEIGKAIGLGEITDPAAPLVNRSYTYLKDDGAGTSQLVTRFNTGPVRVVAAETPRVVTGSRGGNAALASLLTALANDGVITDSTTA